MSVYFTEDTTPAGSFQQPLFVGTFTQWSQADTDGTPAYVEVWAREWTTVEMGSQSGSNDVALTGQLWPRARQT